MGETFYYLGIDWGREKTGLALADSELKIATPLMEVKTNKLLDFLDKLRREYNIRKVVVGELFLMDKFKNSVEGEELSKMRKAFRRKLAENGWQVYLAEEILSTRLAHNNLKEKGLVGLDKNDNAEAAKIILQGWLDNQSQLV